MMNKWIAALLRMALGSWLLLSPGMGALASINPVGESDLGIWSVVPGPTTSDLNDVVIVSPTDGWAVGDGGTILHWNGTNWTQTTSPVANDLYSIAMVAADDGWIVGDGVVLRWDGSSWSQVPGAPKFGFFSVDAIGSNAWMVGGYLLCNPACNDLMGIIYRWDGSIWSVSYVPHVYLYSIDMLSLTSGWAVGDTLDPNQNLIIRWNGSTWAPFDYTHSPSRGLYDIAVENENLAWAVGLNENYVCDSFRWNGTSWTEVSCPEGIYFTSVAVVSDNEAWAVSWSGKIAYWNGVDWALVSSPTTVDLSAVRMVSSNEGWAVGKGGMILRYKRALDATLEINHVGGAPGSYFTLTGENFPPNATATVEVNWHKLGTVPTDASGNLTFLLNTDLADEGFYTVTVSTNPGTSTGFVIKVTEPVRPKEGAGKVFDVPAGIAFTQVNFVPAVLR